jgi:hypothetical protein
MHKAIQTSQAGVDRHRTNGKFNAADLLCLAINTQADVAAVDAIATFEVLRTRMDRRRSPCVLDTFFAKAFMNWALCNPGGGATQSTSIDSRMRR